MARSFLLPSQHEFECFEQPLNDPLRLVSKNDITVPQNFNFSDNITCYQVVFANSKI